jgi:hypothetical protein
VGTQSGVQGGGGSDQSSDAEARDATAARCRAGAARGRSSGMPGARKTQNTSFTHSRHWIDHSGGTRTPTHACSSCSTSTTWAQQACSRQSHTDCNTCTVLRVADSGATKGGDEARGALVCERRTLLLRQSAQSHTRTRAHAPECPQGVGHACSLHWGLLKLDPNHCKRRARTPAAHSALTWCRGRCAR